MMMTKKEIFNSFKISSVYIAATIGAGFASGKEIFIYFTQYKSYGIFNIYLTGIIFFLVSVLFLNFIRNLNPIDYKDFFTLIFNTKIAPYFSSLVTIFMLGVLSIMISGMANIIISATEINYFFAILFITALCYIVLIKGINGIVFLSQLITPLLICGIIILCILFLKDANILTVTSSNDLIFHWSISSIMYIAYNILISTAVIIEIKYLITSKKTILFSSLISSLSLFATTFLINQVLIKYYNLVINEPLPMLSLAKLLNSWIFYLWSIVLFLAMFSTAISCAVGIIDYIKTKFKISNKIVPLIPLIIIIPLTQLGFTELILLFYPIFGVIGLLIIILVIKNSFKLLKR